MPPYVSSSLIPLSTRSSQAARRALRSTNVGRIRRRLASNHASSSVVTGLPNAGFAYEKRALDNQHELRIARSILLSVSRLRGKESSGHGLSIEPLVEACDVLSVQQPDRNITVTGAFAVCGGDAAQNLVAVLLDDPLSPDPLFRSQLHQRWAREDGSEENRATLRFQQTRTDSNDGESIILPSPFFSRFSSPIILQEPHPSSSPTNISNHLLRSDIPIFVTSALASPSPHILSYFSSSPHGLLLIDGAFDPSSPSTDAFRSEIAVRYGIDESRVILVDAARALRGAAVLSTDPSSASAVRTYQSDTLASGVPDLLRALTNIVSQYGPVRLRKDVEKKVTRRALATMKEVINSAKEEAREVQSQSSALQQGALEARERAEVEILGGDADVAVQGEQGRVSLGIEKVQADLKPVLNGLTWYRLPFVVDDVSVRVDRAVEHAFGREFENELVFHTGRLASLQADFVSRTNSFISSLPPAFRSPLLQNTLAQIASSPSFPITHSSPVPDSSRNNSAPTPPALLTPLRTRTAQLAHATRSLHLSAQRLLLVTFANTTLSSLSSALLYVHFSIDASTSIGFGALATLAGLRWAVGRWAKARERWFGAFGRVGEGLERDMSVALGAVLDRQVCVLPNEACSGVHRLVEKRGKEIADVEDEVEELEASLGTPEGQRNAARDTIETS